MEPTPSVPVIARPAYRSARTRVAVVAAGLTIAWIALVVWVNADAPGVPAIDSSLHGWALEHRTVVTIEVARAVSWFGQTTVTLPLVVLGGLAATVSTRRFGRLRAAALLLVMGALGTGVGLAINVLVGRVRPQPCASMVRRSTAPQTPPMRWSRSLGTRPACCSPSASSDPEYWR